MSQNNFSARERSSRKSINKIGRQCNKCGFTFTKDDIANKCSYNDEQ